MNKKRTFRLLLMWFTAFAMAGILGLMIYFQMSDHQENVVGTLLIGPPEELTDNTTVEQSQDNETTELMPEKVAKVFSIDYELSHLVETSSPYWDVIPITEAGISSENWHTIMVQNRHKIDYTITPFSPREWHLVRSKNSIKVQFPYEMSGVKDILARKKRGKFSIQLISIEHDRFPHAVSLLKRLLHQGYYAYLQRTETEFENKYWFRVRVGFFKNLEDTRAAGNKIMQKFQEEELFSSKYWPVQPGPQELSRPVIDLRQPLNKPWVIQLPLYESHADVLKDLADLSTQTDFSYISQKLQSDSSDEQVYRIRIGFFETKQEAKRTVYGIKKKLPQFKKLKLIRL